MPTPAGIFILGELTGPVADEIHEITRRYDPKLANARHPHLTLAGSSGVGPIAAATSVEELRTRLAPIAASTAPIELAFEIPHRYTQTNTIVLPIPAYGPIRELHDRVASSGLHFGPARFTFSPHVTLNLYRTLTRETARELLALHIPGPVMLRTLHCYYTSAPMPARRLLSLELTGGSPAPAATIAPSPPRQ